MANDSTSPPYDSVDPRTWYPQVREALTLGQACREYLTAVEFSAGLAGGDPRAPEADRRILECIVNLNVASAAELAMDITPYEMGRAVARAVMEWPRENE